MAMTSNSTTCQAFWLSLAVANLARSAKSTLGQAAMLLAVESEQRVTQTADNTKLAEDVPETVLENISEVSTAGRSNQLPHH